MNQRKWLLQTTQPVNRITIQDLPTQFVELSDKELQQIVGGRQPRAGGQVGGSIVNVRGYKKLDDDNDDDGGPRGPNLAAIILLGPLLGPIAWWL
jgi:bacteriocin-like protein